MTADVPAFDEFIFSIQKKTFRSKIKESFFSKFMIANAQTQNNSNFFLVVEKKRF